MKRKEEGIENGRSRNLSTSETTNGNNHLPLLYSVSLCDPHGSSHKQTRVFLLIPLNQNKKSG